MTKAQPRAGESGTGAYTARLSQVTGPAGRVTAGRSGYWCTGWSRFAWHAPFAAGRRPRSATPGSRWSPSLWGRSRLVFSEVIPGSLAAGSAAGGVLYDSYPRRRVHRCRRHRCPGRCPCSVVPAPASAGRQQVLSIFSASEARRRRRCRMALSMEQQAGHREHAESPFTAQPGPLPGRNCYA